jgi:hypothetical protein
MSSTAWIGKTSERWSDSDAFMTLADCVRQSNQIVVIGIERHRQRPGMADELPAARCGYPTGVPDAQVPGMWFAGGRERSDDGRGIGVNEGQRRHRILGAPRPAAATRNIHAREAIAR